MKQVYEMMIVVGFGIAALIGGAIELESILSGNPVVCGKLVCVSAPEWQVWGTVLLWWIVSALCLVSPLFITKKEGKIIQNKSMNKGAI